MSSADWPRDVKEEVDGGAKPFRSHLVWAILASLFGVTLLGIVSIVHAVLAKSRFEANEQEGAFREAAHARDWAIVSFLMVIPVSILGRCVMR